MADSNSFAVKRRLEILKDHLNIESECSKNEELLKNFTSSQMIVKSSHLEIETIEKERSRAQFSVKEMTNAIYGKKLAEDLEIVYETFKKEELFSKVDGEDLTTEQYRELTMARINKLLQMNLNRNFHTAIKNVIYSVCSSTSTRFGVHMGLFGGSIANNATDEHAAKYEELVRTGKIFGCFAMTEMGHGSNAAALETTARFIPETQEFEINTPTLTATKWWIGGASHTATHCVAFAKLIIGEKDYGVHSFIVPLRDLQTHFPLPGITLGDCGEKLGLPGVDNGFIQFHNVRVPRENMLSRYVSVSSDGKYHKASKESLALQRLALIGARTGIVAQSANSGMQALIVAIRFGAVRRQFGGSSPSTETAILDYQSHMYRLFPLLAEVYAIHFASQGIEQSYNSLLKELKEGNMQNLNDCHANSAGLKAFCSWAVRDGISICRDCCGGLGYSAYNRLARLIIDFAVQTTWDGDNVILAQQTARYLLSSLAKVSQGKNLQGSVKYLESSKLLLSSKFFCDSEESLMDFNQLLQALQYRTANLCHYIALRLQEEISQGKSSEEAWDECLIDILALAKSHCEVYQLSVFIDRIISLTPGTGLYATLRNLCCLYGLTRIEKDFGSFRENEYMSNFQSNMVRNQIRKLLKLIRPDAIALCDAFNIPDWILNSSIGKFDGNIYESFFERVRCSPLNSQLGQPPKYFDKLIKPLTNKK